MPTIDKIPRVFIIYSREDSEFAAKLSAGLRGEQMNVWIDFMGLEPGTEDWEEAVRDSIKESFAVILIASPSSRKSPFVKSELLLSQANRLPVYAVWAEGDEWIESIPMNLAHIQYLDFRGGRFEQSFQSLLQELKKQNAILPSHFIFKDYYKIVPPNEKKPNGYMFCYDKRGCKIYKKEIPGRYAIIHFSRPYFWDENPDVIVIDASVYKTMIAVLDDIYTYYLSDRFPPFSYGEKWILYQRLMRYDRLIFDWNWINGNAITKTQTDSGFLLHPPDFFGFRPESNWFLTSQIPKRFKLIATNDEELMQILVFQPKALRYLGDEIMDIAFEQEFDPALYKYFSVISESDEYGEVDLAIYVQVKECSEEHKLRWRRGKSY